jgi:hypothetical protein
MSTSLECRYFVHDMLDHLDSCEVYAHHYLNGCITYVVRDPELVFDITINYDSSSRTISANYDTDEIFRDEEIDNNGFAYSMHLMLWALDSHAIEF